LFRVETYLETDGGICGFKKGIALFILGNMATVTILVRHGMADLTTEKIPMGFMGFHVRSIVLINVFVTLQTFGTIFSFISLAASFFLTMHFTTGMAFGAFEIFLLVYITGNISIQTKKFVSNPASVTGSTHLLHGRIFLENMSFEQSTVNRFGTAYVTLAATAVTGRTMFLTALLNFFADFAIRIASLLDSLANPSYIHMKIALVAVGDVIMTPTTTFRGIRKGGIFFHISMGCLPVGIIRISPMAFMTTNSSMVFVI
jgi:hypothetical protein